MEIIAQPLALPHLLDAESRVSVRQREEEVPAGNRKGENDHAGDPASDQGLAEVSLPSGDEALGLRGGLLPGGLIRLRAEHELDKATGNQARGKMGGEVVVQE